MSIFARGLVAAMEDETNAAELGIDATGADSAEADLVEAADISADVEAGSAEIEQATADADTLTRIADTAQASEEDGGMDPVAAEVAEIAVEAIYARLGVRSTSYPALESFSGRTGRVRATRIAVEEMMDTVKKVWAAVVTAFRKIIDFVKSFFGKLFDGNRKMEARANALQKQVNTMEQTPGGKVKSHGLGKVFGDFTPESAVKDVGAITGELKALAGVVNGIITGLGSMAEEVKVNVTGKDDSWLDRSKAANDVITAAKQYQSAGGTLLKPRLDLKFGDGPKTTMGEKAGNAWDAVKSFGVTIKENVPFTEKTEVDSLSKAQVSAMLTNVKAVAAFNSGQKAALAAFEKGINKALEAARAVAETAPETLNADQSNTKKNMAIARAAITATGNASMKMFTYGGKIGTQFAKAGLDYAEASLKAAAPAKADAVTDVVAK